MAHTLSQQEFTALNQGSVSPLSSARVVPPIVAMCLAMLSAWLLSTVISDGNSNPVAALLLISGIISVFYALMRPWNSLLLFVWLAVTIDAIKRLTFALSNMNMLDVAQILAVPVLLMGGIYLRIIFLHWFVARHEITKVDLAKFWPILLLSVVATGALLLKEGTSFGTIAANYQFLCYIPAAVAVPHLLNSSQRWDSFSRTLLWATLTIGVYGTVQIFHGPLDYEMEYLRSGLTSTIGLTEEDYFRAFSLLNTSATFAGMMMIGGFFSLYHLCRRDGRLRLTWATGALLLFCAGCCIGSTQRGAFFTGLLIISMLPLFRYPHILKLLLGVALGAYTLLIVFAGPLLEWLPVAEQSLDPIRVNDFLRQNAHVLTFAPRLDGLMSLQNPAAWTLFGGGEVGSGHNLASDLLAWTGAVGLGLFVVLLFTVVNFSLRTMSRLRVNPRVFLWAQINLAVFLYIVTWSAILGSAIHISPMNFFFWVSLGNLIFIANTPVVNLVEGTSAAETGPDDEEGGDDDGPPRPRLMLAQPAPGPDAQAPSQEVILYKPS